MNVDNKTINNSALNEVANNAGLNAFVSRVYKTSAVALLGTFAFS